MIFVYSIMVALLSINYQVLTTSNRLTHFFVCFLLTFFAKKLDQNYILTIVIVLSMGIAKEIQDPVFDWMDIIANCCGIFIGIML